MKITATTHRGRRVLRWHHKGVPNYRRIKNEANIENEIIELATELRYGGGKPVQPKPVLDLGQMQDRWYQDLLTHASVKAAKTVYKEVVRILDEAAITDVSHITVAKVRTAIARLRVTPRKPKRPANEYPLLSESSRHAYARAIKQFVRWLEEEQLIDSNPLRRWRLTTVTEERYPRDRLQVDELLKLITTTRQSTRIIEGYDGVTRSYLYTVASLTGLRRSELAMLAAENFDFTSLTVTVAASYTKNKKLAVLPLHHQLAVDLQRWIGDKRGPLFYGLKGKRTRKMIKLDLEAAEIPYKTERGVRCFHSLRNTYISSLFDGGAGIAQVQRLARHSDIHLTVKYAKPSSTEGRIVDNLAYPVQHPVPETPE